MDKIINKNVSKVEDIGYDQVVTYTLLETEEGVNIRSTQNFNAIEELSIRIMKHCLEFILTKDSIQPNVNHANYMLEVEMLKNKSCYSLASLIISNYATYNTKESKLVTCFINIITPFGLISINVSDEVENDKIFELSGILDYVYVLYINNKVDSNDLPWLTFKPQEEIPDDGKSILNDYLTGSFIITPKD